MSKSLNLKISGGTEDIDTRLIFKVFSVLVLDCPDLGVVIKRILRFAGFFGDYWTVPTRLPISQENLRNWPQSQTSPESQTRDGRKNWSRDNSFGSSCSLQLLSNSWVLFFRESKKKLPLISHWIVLFLEIEHTDSDCILIICWVVVFVKSLISHKKVINGLGDFR